MPSRPQVDVVVVTYRTPDLTASALRRLLDGDQGVDLRVLVHDNASGDDTVERLRAEVPEAEVEVSDANLGFAAGVNTALLRSRAPWVLLLNSDAWPEPMAIRRLVDAAGAHPTAAAVAPKLVRPDGRLEHSTHPFPSLGIAAVLAFGIAGVAGRRARERWLLEGSWDHDRPREVPWAVGAALLLRRQALDELGGLDEAFFMYAEDLEWCWRAAQAGWSVWFEPSAVVRHVGNASGSAAYGERRTEAYLHNTYRFLLEARGPLVVRGYRWLSLVGCHRNALSARLRGDRDRAAHWSRVAAAHRRAATAHDRPEAVT